MAKTYAAIWSFPDKDRALQAHTAFAWMTPEDDDAQGPGLEILGRWIAVEQERGLMIAKCDYDDLRRYLLHWSPLCNLDIFCVDDFATARAMLQTIPMFAKKE
eukprot:TRINITY_DN6482_c0_g1_i3.p2 TRINITY_DN6482_c0_g1~~TRINITY_DN6482_c0_g1_i3.p2  ORF type:complete len:103 (-),score=27.53 TRINITY_DN6482_c0_g1_i3:180-488(-)